MLEKWLKEAAAAAAVANRSIMVVATPRGVKVWAPEYGRPGRQVIITWDTLRGELVNPLLLAVARMGAESLIPPRVY